MWYRAYVLPSGVAVLYIRYSLNGTKGKNAHIHINESLAPKATSRNVSFESRLTVVP